MIRARTRNKFFFKRVFFFLFFLLLPWVMKYTKSKLVGMGTLFFFPHSPAVPEIGSWDGLVFGCEFGSGCV